MGSRCREVLRGLVGLNNPATADTGCTDASPLMGTLDDGPNSLQVWVPAPLCDVVGVTYIVTKKRSLSADVATGCHDSPPVGLLKNAKL